MSFGVAFAQSGSANCVVHDTNPHALSPKVKAFVQAQHWCQDLTQIGLE